MARFLIDGYNVLYALGLPTSLGPGGLQRARERLLAMIRRRYPTADVSVVFDGTRSSGPRAQQGIAVHFSKGEADELIRQLVAHDSAPKSLCVVSSDHAVQTAARRRHAPVLDAEQFVRSLEELLPSTPSSEPERPAMPNDVQHWLAAFGEIDRDPAVRAMQEIEPLGRKRAKKRKAAEP